MTPQMPEGIMDALKMLPMVGRLRDLMPKTVKDAPCQEVVQRDGTLDELPILKCWPEDGGPLHHVSARVHEGSRDRRAQHRHLSHAGVRRPHDRHALAAAQGRRAALPRGRAARQAARGGRGAQPRAGAAVLRDGADARRARRAAARRLSRAAPDRAGEVRHRRSRSAGQLAHRARRLRRAGRAPPRRAVRRSHRLLLAARRLSGVPPHLHHAAQAADLPDDDRRHSADGGLLPRHGERADLPADDPQDAAGDRRHALSGRGHLPQPRASSRSTSAIPATRARS